MIPLVDLAAISEANRQRIEQRLEPVMKSGRFILGPEVEELEGRLASFAGAAAAIGVSSGSDALRLVLMLKRIGPGDAVFLPAFTFIATAEAVAAQGATPVLVDVSAEDFTLDPEDLSAQVGRVKKDGGLRAAAVIPVDLFGTPARYDRILPLAEEEGLEVIADAAQSFGGLAGKARVGSIAPFTCVSFYPTKPLGCFGDGGAVLTTAREAAPLLRSLRQHGIAPLTGEAEMLGMNGRLDTIQAAILLARLETFGQELGRRRLIADWYDAELSNRVVTPRERPGVSSAWAVYAIRSPLRDRIRAALSEKGVASAIYYHGPVCDHPAYKDLCAFTGPLPVARALCGELLALPMHPYLSASDVEEVSSIVRGVCLTASVS